MPKKKSDLDKFYDKAQDPAFDPILELLRIIAGLQGQVQDLYDAVERLTTRVALAEARAARRREPDPTPAPAPWRKSKPWSLPKDPPAKWTLQRRS
jgi:hypothetical protein